MLGEVPVATFPNARLVGLREMAAGFWPVPVRPATVGELLALLVNETLPATAPATVGAKVTDADCVPPFAAKVNGYASPVTLSPAPVTVCPVIVSEAVPVFVSVSVCVVLLLMMTLPKATVVGDRTSVAVPGATALAVNVAVTGEVVPSFTTDTLPVTFEAATDGANEMLTD